MRRRWIIRSFFIDLLLLCVGGWVGSYQYSWGVSYWGRNLRAVQCGWGQIRLIWADKPAPFPWSTGGWRVYACLADEVRDMALDIMSGPHILGFGMPNEPGPTLVIVPFWFPTTLSAALLWLVWRKTRPKEKGRAFPVEMAETEKQP